MDALPAATLAAAPALPPLGQGRRSALPPLEQGAHKTFPPLEQGGVRGGPTAQATARIDAVAQEFEAVFLSEMLKPMFAGIETKPPFGGGHGEEVFRGLLLTEYGKAIAARGGVGIADAVRAEIIRMQGGA